MNIRLMLYCLGLLFSLHGVACKSKTRKFPKNFLFGAATAAYQIEGGWNEDGKSRSIWDAATHSQPSPILDGSTGDIAADSYHLYKRDVQMIMELELDIYRFSIAWTRILPDGLADKINHAGLEYYSNLIDELIKNNIKPFATIYHWDLPESLQKLGGWTNPHISDWFADYAKVLFSAIGGKVKLWVTIDEPKQICYEGYGSDIKAPFLNYSGIAEYLCAKNVLLAHAKAYRIYDESFRKVQNGSVGISVGCTWYEPASQSDDDISAARDAIMFDWGMYTEPIFSKGGDFPLEVRHNVATKSAEQGYPRSRLPKLSTNEVNLIKGSSDFLAVTAYTTKLVYRDASLDGMFAVPSYDDDLSAVRVKDQTVTTSSWMQAVPMLRKISKLYNNPSVHLTHHGLSSNSGLLDDDRIKFLWNYLGGMLTAVEEGCNVKSYSVSHPMDTFEWKNGYTEKLGLYEVDFSSPERTRVPRKSVYVYKQMIKTKLLDTNYDPTYVVDNSHMSSTNEHHRDDLF